MSQSYAVFYSPSVAQGAQLPLLKAAFSECRLQAKFYDVDECQRIAGRTKAGVLVAAGGDGTVNTVAAQACRVGKSLGLVPMGTLNHFAKDLGVPLVPLQAVQVLAHGKAIKVDIGTAGDNVFLNNASLGIYPTLVHSRTRLEHLLGKWPAAAIAMCQVATRRLRLYQMQLTLDGKTIERRSSLLFVGNNRYDVQGAGLPQRSNLWSGQLHIFVLKTKRINRLLKIALYLILGRRLPERYIERFSAKTLEVAVQARSQLWLAYDGEVSRAQLPLQFRLQAHALSVIAPPET